MTQQASEQSINRRESAEAIASASTGVAAAALTVVSAACCVSPVLAPIIVSVLGASGAVWAAGLRPYGWWILGGTLACLAYGFWLVYRPRQACEVAESTHRRAWLPRIAKVSLWFGAACWMTGVLLRVLLPS